MARRALKVLVQIFVIILKITLVIGITVGFWTLVGIISEDTAEGDSNPYIDLNNCSQDYWKYSGFKGSLRCALAPSEIEKLTFLSKNLKDPTIQGSAWNVLEWIDKNIDYNYTKAELEDCVIYWRNGFAVSVEGNKTIQRPLETVVRGKGICSDIAILTAALLLNMNISPVYLFDIQFLEENETHASAAIKINGEYFMLDQHLSIKTLGGYYEHWRILGKAPLKEPRTIINAKVYEVKILNDNIKIVNVENLTQEDFIKKIHSIDSLELKRLESDIFSLIIQKYSNLKADSKIQNLDEMEYTPRGYSDGITWSQEFKLFAVFYSPEFRQQFAEYIIQKLTEHSEVNKDLQTHNRFWLELEKDGDNLKLRLHLANR